MILAALNIFALFLLALMVPFVSFMLPVYKIKKMRKLNIRGRIVANILAMGAIALMDVTLLFAYIGVFIVIETLYYYFEKFKSDMGIFDRMFISTSVVTCLALIFSLLVTKDTAAIMEANKNLYVDVMKLDPKQVEEIFSYISKNSLFIMFIYSFICNYLTYFTLKSETYGAWEMSYKWIIIYMLAFFSTRFIGSENFYLNNLLNISKTMYMVFGIKVICSIFGKKFSIKGVTKFLAIMIAATFPTAVFILGALNSFNMVKLRIEKK